MMITVGIVEPILIGTQEAILVMSVVNDSITTRVRGGVLGVGQFLGMGSDGAKRRVWA